MADEQSPQESQGTPEVDPLKNLKAEFSRKLDNVASELAEQRKINEQLLSSLRAPVQQPQQKELSDLMYTDPEAYAAAIAAKAEKAVNEKLAVRDRQTSVIQQIVQEYPETADQNHPLTKRAVEIYTSFGADEKASPVAYRAAVAEAAVELGVKPKSKRPVDDEPSMGSSSYSPRQSRRAKAQLDPATEQFAAIMGLDLSDSKTKDNLMKRSQRNWNRYEKVSK